ncbi:MAG: hypothetical protein GF414_08525 [Candidatus Altiarchaeales archaeon]|nr:hypothetical protein [Candidatus Altiarchaeales archaeon]
MSKKEVYEVNRDLRRRNAVLREKVNVLEGQIEEVESSGYYDVIGRIEDGDDDEV